MLKELKYKANKSKREKLSIILFKLIDHNIYYGDDFEHIFNSDSLESIELTYQSNKPFNKFLRDNYGELAKPILKHFLSYIKYNRNGDMFIVHFGKMINK